ncbi:bifunctional 4-hydroxy-2-oxoglutarate aldolase/2-dehydro-3-deoxy-phosphogluconate aldolase [Rhodomicrobium lacus]|jgi:2-dehydro-3-deoxyphosphogluconate aldolase/(4S)-4-hydroxy-2-oxoglutarate aldolase|uniref:bifunctional 4-hydroxy-2-oxoglutarate aldolase/2-dehydro-3-deoxy-phosphogluconate aldolase n=1 Tax=Rhodomicrobium TaxID=1068 RepID=UPI0026E1DA9F|nr:bifunctional 4-hydroxy-2-oxoglutarate aldolase/2-dehydro-3-deoxy-phosphogluconate aldolase [Rhodomicrobium lacus]WKW50353.1 bifunctional 4-hydroxy-2-oxoglutarate aldolase/2-dehydro-3-deoxy-phosphogluconate aldolase [Rhodomicrobium lacus]
MTASAQAGLESILSRAAVIPVVVIDKAEDGVPLARALLAGGLPVIEITLRTGAALDAIRAIANEVPEAVVGAGTVLDGALLKAARESGARFAVSPGATPRLLDAADSEGVPLLPGIGTASEAMALIERGYRFAKFFPAEASGGPALLASLASPLPQLKFCPTGGITHDNAPRYLKLPNVICVGGSWMVNRARIAEGDWPSISALAKAAAALHTPVI